MSEFPLKLLAWESTRACKFACIHCRAKATPEREKDELNTSEIYSFIDDLSAMGNIIFIITGGDPLLRNDIFDISKYATQKGLKVVMSPSGSDITPTVIENIKTSGVKRLSLSLDGPDNETHDSFRRVPGSFDNSIAVMELLQTNRMPFQINTTVTKMNYKQLSLIHDLAVKHKAVRWDVFFLVPTGRGDKSLEITPEQYEEVLRAIIVLQETSSIDIKVTCAPHYLRIISQQGRKPNISGCLAGKGFAFISHKGEVFGCGYLPISSGNIKNEKFSYIYKNSEIFNKIRNPASIKGKCSLCEYLNICGGCRARAYASSGDYLSEEPGCIYLPGSEVI